MLETSKNTAGKSGDPNTKTNNNKSGVGSGSGSGKQNEKDTQSHLVDQGKPTSVEVEIHTENKSEKKLVPSKINPKKKPIKERSETEKVKDIQSLLEGIFMVASLKAGEHWQLQPDESKQIATPLSRILERYDLLGKTAEVSDPVALIVASATIIFPRIMLSKLSADNKKTETLKKNGAMADVKEKKYDDGHSRSNNDPAKTSNTDNDGKFFKSVHNQIQTGF